MDIGKQIKEEREQQGLTVEELATKAGLPISLLKRIEDSDKKVSLNAIIFYAKALDKKVSVSLLDSGN